MKKSGNATLTLPANIAYLPAIQGFVGQLAKTAGLPPEDVDFLQLAVEEATANVIEHAFLPDEDATFEIVCEHTPIEFTVRVRDKGLPFDPGQVKGYRPGPDLDQVGGPGLGIRLMKSSVDTLALNNLGYKGKETVLTKFIHQKHIEDYFSPEHLERFEEKRHETEKPGKKVPFHVQLLQPEQAIEVAQCAYRTYGYTYIMENVYYPDRLVQMTQTGDLISAVAVSRFDQEVMSHCALEFHGHKHGIPEIGMGFTKPAFRGMGCLSGINEFILDHAKERGIKGIYSKAVTTHPYSQKSLNKFGFRPCGVLVGHSPPKEFARMDKQLTQRETLILYHRKIVEIPPLKIYSPPSHRDIIERIFQENGIGVGPAHPRVESHTASAEEHSHVECDVNHRLRLAHIYINSCGRDLEQELPTRVKHLCQKKIESILLYLDLTDPGINSATGFLEKQNCYFAGVLLADPHPYLIFQYLNHVFIDYDQVKIYDSFARELLDYIMGRDPNLD